MYTNIVDPLNNQPVSLFSYEGKQLLKKYVHTFQKNNITHTFQTGGAEEQTPLETKCSKPLYNLTKTITDEIEEGCDIDTYSNDHQNSINFILTRGLSDNLTSNERKIEIYNRKELAKQISGTVINKLAKLGIQGKTTILGPVEDIVGLLMHFNEAKTDPNLHELYNNLVILSVPATPENALESQPSWTTDLNHDFINCSIKDANNSDNSFEGLDDKCPIVLISTEKNILKDAKPFAILNPTRVTHCEVQWVSKLLQKQNEKYDWVTYETNVSDKPLYINCLLKRSN
jgi:hypothetical protein